AIVGDEACERQPPAGGGGNQIEREARLARAGRAADQHGARADEHRRGMDGGAGRSRHIAGNRITKRAPKILVSRSLASPTRFSARMRPPCASTICREMESPSPEFWPKP